MRKAVKPTRYNVYREDVKEAINFSRRPYYMEEYLRRKGYITDFTGKHWKIRLPQYEHFTRLDTLDERWTPEHIQRTMGVYASFGNRRATITYPPQMPQSLRDWFKAFSKDKPYLPAVSALLLSVRRPAEKNRLPPHKPLSQRGFKEAGGTIRTGAVYEQIRHKDF